MRFAGNIETPLLEEAIIAQQQYPADQWNKDDDILLRSLERGELGDSPKIREAILDLRQRRKMFGVRGV